MCVFSCNLPPIGIWQNGRDRLHATAIKTGWPERILDKVRTKSYSEEDNGRLSCGSPRLVALGIFGALTKLKSAANDLRFTSQVALGLFGQRNAQAGKVTHSAHEPSAPSLSCQPQFHPTRSLGRSALAPAARCQTSHRWGSCRLQSSMSRSLAAPHSASSQGRQ